MAKWIVFLGAACIAGRVGAQEVGQSTDGVWRAVAYRQILKAEPDRVHLYETSGDNCVEVGAAKRRSQSKLGETVFSGEGSSDLQVKSDAAGSISLSMFGSQETKLELERLPALPAGCGSTPNTPVSNYDIFWRTFSEMYPFFGERKIDWADVDKRFRPQVTDATSPTALFDIFQKMIEPLHDVSTAVDAESLQRRFQGVQGKQYSPLEEKLAQQNEEIIRTQYIRGKLRGYCHWIELGPKASSASPLHSGALIHFGMLDNSIGYLRVDDTAVCEKELDHIFQTAAELKGLIVDERFPLGGPRGLDKAIRLASRFTSKDYVGLSRVRGAKSEEEIVPRSSRPGFTGPVAVLTGPDSSPAIELFALALIGRQPPAVRVGSPTPGALALEETMWRALPNGWSFRLPIGKYLAQNGRDYHFTGLPPDVAVPASSADDGAAVGHDLALEKAMETVKQAWQKR